MKTQEDLVLEYLQAHGSITSLEAIKELGIIQLPARIKHLRRYHNITTEFVDGTDRFGKKIKYGVYTLNKEEESEPYQPDPYDEWVDRQLELGLPMESPYARY